MNRRATYLLAGALLTLAVAGFLWTFLYAGVSVLRSQDQAPLKGLLADNIWSSVQHAWSGRTRIAVQIDAGLAALGSLLVSGVLAGAALHRRASPLGNAAFMNAGQAAAAGFFAASGIFFGRLGGISLTWPALVRDPVTKQRRRGQKMRLAGGRYLKHPRIVHAFVTGPTRSGKGTSLIITNALLWPHSLIVLDIRGETFEATAGYRAQFSRVFKFAPAQAVTHGYNPLEFVRDAPGYREADIRAVAHSLVPSLGNEDEYWTKDARYLVAGAISYVLESPAVREKTLAAVMDVLQGDTDVIDRLSRILVEEEEKISAFTRRTLLPFLSMSEKQFSGLYGNLRVALEPYTNPYIARATAFSSFDIRAFRKEATTLYVDFRLSQTATIAPLVNLLLSQIVNFLSETRMSAGERPVLMLLDEFSNLGRLEPILSMWKVLAGNGVGVWAFVQSLTDVDRFYGRDGRNTLLDNSDLQIFLGSQSPDILEHFEKLLGQKTVRVKSRSTSGTFMSHHRNVSLSEREIAVPLMSQDELRRMPDTRFIVLPMNQFPIFARKNYFFADPLLRRFAHRSLPRSWIIPNLDRGLGRSIFAPPRAAAEACPPAQASFRRPGAIAPGSIFLAHAARPKRQDSSTLGPRAGAAFKAAARVNSCARKVANSAAEMDSAAPGAVSGEEYAAARSAKRKRKPVQSRPRQDNPAPIPTPEAPAPDTVARLDESLVSDDDTLIEAMAALGEMEEVERAIPADQTEMRVHFRRGRKRLAKLAVAVAAPESAA